MSRSDSTYFCFQAPLPKHFLLKDLVSNELNDFFFLMIHLDDFVSPCSNESWMNVFASQASGEREHSASPHEAAQQQLSARGRVTFQLTFEV